MPVIIVKTLELLDEQKEEIAEKFVSILSEVMQVPKPAIYLFFEGAQLNELAVGGKMLSKNPPTAGKAKFNTPNITK
jgi:4-oxalocrotonate tautomerase family enzyme